MYEIFALVNKMSPYILLGFLLAGLMHAFLPSGIYRRFLGGNSFRAVFNAALLGVPLPLCSCGVIPTAMSLRREGASRGATVAFLISTPQTGVDSIIATYSLMGLPFALLRPLIALVTAVFGGFFVSRLTPPDARDAASASSMRGEGADAGFLKRLGTALHYAFVEMMQDIGRWLMLGLLVAGLITVFVPDAFFAAFVGKPFLSMLVVLLFAVPMYLCATGSIPIAAALMLKGLSPGAALVLLMAGPAVNAASILVIGKVMGRRTMLLYLASIVCGAVGFGLLIDHFLPREWFVSPLTSVAGEAHAPSWFSIGCTILLVLLLVNAFVQKRLHGNACACHACGEDEAASVDAALVLRVKGMSCNHCKANVERAILRVGGAESAEADLLTGRTVVRGRVDAAAVRAAVEAIGFEVGEA